VRDWVIETLGSLADDDDHNSRLRETMRLFLQERGSFKVTAERLHLHKNTVQYRVRRAEESLGRSIGDDRLNVELALLAAQWLGSTVLYQVADRDDDRGGRSGRRDRQARSRPDVDHRLDRRPS
jgi:hypothetical protein